MLDIEVVKRDGEVVKFDRTKIEGAVLKAATAAKVLFADHEVKKVVDGITAEIEERFTDSDLLLNVENIHDLVEKHLMRSDHYEVAKSYIVYRAQKRQREGEDRKKLSFLKTLKVKKKDGSTVAFNPKKLKETIKRHSKGLPVDQSLVFQETVKNVYDEMKSEDIDKSLVLSATALIELEPAYSQLSARFFRQRLAKEVFGKSTEGGSAEYQKTYRSSLKTAIQNGVEAKVFDERLLDFDLDALAKHMVLERDELLKFIGIQTLQERYFAKVKGRRVEMPQVFWMRVAMGLAINEDNKTARACEFYDVMSQLLYIPSTPTLFHSGLTSPQLSSCYLSSVDDDLKHIFRSFSDNAQMAKWSGGIGNDWTNVRSTGALINSTQVDSQGVIPFLKIANDTTLAINRSGKRRGATVAYLETWHLDIEDFLDLRKNTGDERRRTADMNTANWIPDLFMKRVSENGVWTLFSPDEVPDLHHIYGKKFEERYTFYEKQIKKGKIRRYKVVEAVKLWRKMLTMLFETGHPWLTFKDSCNIRSPQDHVGVVHNSNLCCVAADQLVVTDRGLFTVREMYNSFDGINTGYSSWRLAGRESIVNSSAMLMPRPNAPMRKIVTKEGYTHKVTPDHKLWVLDHGHKEAQNLVPGDKIALQSINRLWGGGKDDDVAFICGLIAGDGTFCGDDTVHIDVWDKDAFIIPEVERLVTLIIERHGTILKYDHACCMEPKFTVCEGGKYRLTSSALNEVLKYKGFNKNSKLNVPDFVLKGSENTVKAYLRGLYLANGTVQGGEVTVGSLCSTNLKLLEVVQILWVNFGAKTSLTKMEDEGFRILPDGKGGKKEYWCNAKYRLMHTCIQSCRILEEITGLGGFRKCETFLENIKKDGYAQKMYATFERLEELPNEDAYCLEVDAEDHLWTVNGFLTKNTEITLNTKPSKLNDDYTTKELGEIAVCLAEGTKILTDSGLKNIEDCDGNNVFVPMKSDIDHMHRPRFVNASLIDNGIQDVLTVTTKYGPTLTMTKNHLVMVYVKHGQKRPNRKKDTLVKLTWKRADELKVGDRLYCPETPPVVTKTNYDEVYASLGWFLGDGWFTDSCGLVFGPDDSYAEQVTIPVFKYFYDQTSSFGRDKFPKVHEQKNGVRIWGSERKALHSMLIEKFGFKCGRGPTKKLPSKVYNWSLDQQASFLAGLFSADGGVSFDGRGRLTINLASSSSDVLDEVQLLLKSFGIHMRKTWFFVKGRDRWQGSLRTNSIPSITAFSDLIGFKLSPNKQKFVDQYLASSDSQRNALPHFTIDEIKPAGKKKVYDLSLKEGHHFIANGFISHNCNLGSLNIYRFMHKVEYGVHADQWKWEINWELLARTIKTAMRMLDNVIDINFYPVPEAKASNLRHRPVGIGFMGLQDALFLADIRYEEADDFVDELQEFIAYHAIWASSTLAVERGPYETYKGSKWDRGIFPLDTIDLLEKERGVPVEIDRRSRQDWAFLKEHVKNHGMRNSNTMAVAPTATISGIAGVLGPCGEATYKNIFTKANMSGEFTVVNEFLIEDLKKEGLWNKEMLDMIKYHNGSIQRIEKIPLRLRAKYKEIWEIDQKRAIDLTALRAKWIDQSQSHNVFVAHNSGKLLAEIYMHAWRKGLKTTYYLRTLGASGVEKATLDVKYGLTQKREEEVPAVKVCRIDDPTCEACQ